MGSVPRFQISRPLEDPPEPLLGADEAPQASRAAFRDGTVEEKALRHYTRNYVVTLHGVACPMSVEGRKMGIRLQQTSKVVFRKRPKHAKPVSAKDEVLR